MEGEHECSEVQDSDKQSREHFVTLAFPLMHQHQDIGPCRPCLATALHEAVVLLYLPANTLQLALAPLVC